MSTKIMITLDLKKNRIRIHKSTLELLGKPKNIHILVNPKKCKLIIKPTYPDKRASLKIIYKRDVECEFYSVILIRRLSKLLPQNNPECTYRIVGRIILHPNLALFDINDAVIYNGAEDNEISDIVRSEPHEQ